MSHFIAMYLIRAAPLFARLPRLVTSVRALRRWWRMFARLCMHERASASVIELLKVTWKVYIASRDLRNFLHLRSAFSFRGAPTESCLRTMIRVAS